MRTGRRFLHFIIWDTISWWTGPYPSFYLEYKLRSDINNRPEYRYYLWTRVGRFQPTILVGSTTSRAEVDRMIQDWSNTNES